MEYGGDGTFAWGAASLVSVVLLVPFASLTTVVPAAVLAVVCGWIVGIAREARIGVRR